MAPYCHNCQRTHLTNLEKNLAHFLSTQHALLLQMINRMEDEDIGMLRSSLIFSVQAANSWSYTIDDVYWFLKQDNKSEKLNE